MRSYQSHDRKGVVAAPHGILATETRNFVDVGRPVVVGALRGDFCADGPAGGGHPVRRGGGASAFTRRALCAAVAGGSRDQVEGEPTAAPGHWRSEERRVGKECRSRW